MAAMRLADIPRPPLHNLLLPHDGRYPFDARGCPEGCQYRQWVEAQEQEPQP